MILQDISDRCDHLPAALREEKERQHYTYPQIAQATGVPEHTVGKFFSGSLSNPSVFHVAAFCILFHVSLDSLFGISNPQTDSQLRQELAVTKMALSKTEEQVSIYRTGIQERKPLIYGLCGLCISLSLMLANYVRLDAQDPSAGLIRQDSVSPVIVLGILAAVCAGLYLAYAIVKRGRKR